MDSSLVTTLDIEWSGIFTWSDEKEFKITCYISEVVVYMKFN